MEFMVCSGVVRGLLWRKLVWSVTLIISVCRGSYDLWHGHSCMILSWAKLALMAFGLRVQLMAVYLYIMDGH
jgi:membrane protein YdbS with pleckstrin-like domain